MKTKPTLIISYSAAARLFLRISALPVAAASIGELNRQLSEAVAGDIPPESVDFALCGEARDEIRDMFLKAIRRSASARVAAARRKLRPATIQPRPDLSPPPSRDPFIGCTAYIYSKLPRSEWMVFDPSQICIAVGYGPLPPKYEGCRKVYRGHFDDGS